MMPSKMSRRDLREAPTKKQATVMMDKSERIVSAVVCSDALAVSDDNFCFLAVCTPFIRFQPVVLPHRASRPQPS